MCLSPTHTDTETSRNKYGDAGIPLFTHRRVRPLPEDFLGVCKSRKRVADLQKGAEEGNVDSSVEGTKTL